MSDLLPFLQPDVWEQLLRVPNAVARLRGLILGLAVRGQLVPQNADDEPAQLLVKRIAAQREQMVRDKKIRATETLPPIEESEKPFALPQSWEWVRLREVTHDLGQMQPQERFTYIDVTSIDKEHGVISNEVRVLEADEAPSRARKIVAQNTVIYSMVRPYLLNIAVINREFEPEPIVSTAFAVLHPFSGLDSRFLFFYTRSQPFTDFVSSKMVGMAYPAISDGDLRPAPIPLPPLTEQKRIVAKVDELMALCDDLEAQLRQAQETGTALWQAIVANDE